MNYTVEHLLSVENKIGEAPLWVPEEETLYWTGMESSTVWSRQEGNGSRPALLRSYKLTLPVTSILRRREGGFILVTKEGIAFWDERRNECELIANPLAGEPALCFNDGTIDRQGRLVTGTMNFTDPAAADGNLYRVDGERTVSLLDTGLSVANGITLSPDGRKLYVSEQFKGRILAYDYEPESGVASNRTVFAELPEEEGLPDGLISDEEGYLWNCHWGGSLITRYAPDGTKELQIPMPVPVVACCAFGGKDLTELYVTTGWYGMSDEDRKRTPGGGDLYRIRTDIKGRIESQFAG